VGTQGTPIIVGDSGGAAALEIPAGALPGDTEITLESWDPWGVVPPSDAVFFSRAFTFEPDGLTFGSPATVTITYTDADVVGIEESTLDVFSYDPTTQEWDLAEVTARDTVNNKITIAVPHFSVRGPTRKDSDGDGCINVLEEQEEPGSQVTGGLRKYTDKNDFYDVGVTGGAPGTDGLVDLANDILAVIQHYQPVEGGAPPYDERYDRGPQIGPNPWNLGPADGKIDLANDILGVIQQFQHDCRVPE
jgi:hypothetical protein